MSAGESRRRGPGSRALARLADRLEGAADRLRARARAGLSPYTHESSGREEGCPALALTPEQERRLADLADLAGEQPAAAAGAPRAFPGAQTPPLTARLLDWRSRHRQLRLFSCGRRGRPWETTVNHWVEGVYRGRAIEAQRIIALEDPSGATLGLVSLKPRSLQLPGRGEVLERVPYIHMLAVDRRHQRRGVGSELVVTALAEVAREWPEGPRRPAWTLVHPRNGPARTLLERHGFRALPRGGERDDLVMVLLT